MTSFVSITGMDSIQISIIHDNICELIHTKCHWRSYHSDINYTKYDVECHLLYGVTHPYILLLFM